MQTNDLIGKFDSLLAHFGVAESFLTGRHCPCPLCGGVDRFRYDNKDGRGTYFCSGCGAGDGIKLLMKFTGKDFKSMMIDIESVQGVLRKTIIYPDRSYDSKLAAIRTVINGSRPISKGDPVWLYLNRRTKLDNFGFTDLRYHPSLVHSNGNRYPAMIGILRDANGDGTTVHRTYLTKDGHKAEIPDNKKFMSGLDLPGSVIRLGYHHSTDIGIAEGVETALAASKQFGMDVWAANTASLLESFIPPFASGSVTIFGDNDLGYMGQKSAYNLAHRLYNMKDRPYKVIVRIPSKTGADWCHEG